MKIVSLFGRVFVLVAFFAATNAWSAVATILEFSVDPSSWTEQEQSTIRQLVTEFNPLVSNVSGPSAQNGNVVIMKGSAEFMPREGGGGTIFVPDIDQPDKLAHEMCHAYRSPYIMTPVYEEGLARACEVWVMAHSKYNGEYWNANHGYEVPVYYSFLNSQGAVSAKDGNIFAGFNPLIRYELASYAFGKMLIEDPAFLRKFHAAYFPTVKKNRAIAADMNVLRDIMARIKPMVEGRRFRDWYSAQAIFRIDPPVGYQVVWKPITYVGGMPYVFYRDERGMETMQTSVPFSWEKYDARGVLLGKGGGLTGPGGWEFITYDASSPMRMRYVLSVGLPDGFVLTKEFVISDAAPDGLFGIVRGYNDGKVAVRDDRGKTYWATVTDGAFAIPELADKAGRKAIWFLPLLPRARTEFLGYVTTDGASYYVDLAPK